MASQSEVVPYTFSISGEFLTNLPDDAIGILSNNDNYPTYWKDDDRGYYELEMTDRQFNIATFSSNHRFEWPMYLGCIIKRSDRSVIWVNNTRPLPD